MSWKTGRQGDPLAHIQAWGIDGDHDLIALRAHVRYLGDRPPEWTMAHLAPLTVPRRESYYDQPVGHLPPHMQRKVAAAEQRRHSFLQHLANGKTVAEACAAVGIARQTFTQWKNRWPEFRNRVERIHVGLPETEDTNDNFVSRRKYYFGYETYTHHQMIIDAIEDTPDGGITMIIVPPEAGKTQLLTDWICDKVAADPNVRITYVSESAEEQSPAMKVLSSVKDRMTDPMVGDPDTQTETHIPEWINSFGPFHDETLDRNKPWNRKYIKVHKASGRRDYTFQAVSWRSKIYGSRCDWMIFDDVQSDESINLTDKMLSRFRKTFFNRPGKEGHIVFIGTRVGVGDVYERLVEEIPDRMIRFVQIPALDEHGNSYCPEMWPLEALEDKRAIVGEDGWATAYIMAPQTAGAVTFTEELLDEARDRSRLYGRRLDIQVSLTLTGLDPALGGGNALVCAQTTSTKFHILAAQVRYGLARNEEIFELIQQFAAHGFTELVVERNSQQRGIARDERLRTISRLFGFRIVEHETGRNKWDLAFGVGAMAGSFIRGEVTVPDGDKDSRRLMEPWRAEMLAWRPNVDPKILRQDLVMATWFTWLIWMQRRKFVDQPAELLVSGGTPWRPGDMSRRWGSRQRSPAGVR